MALWGPSHAATPIVNKTERRWDAKFFGTTMHVLETESLHDGDRFPTLIHIIP